MMVRFRSCRPRNRCPNQTLFITRLPSQIIRGRNCRATNRQGRERERLILQPARADAYRRLTQPHAPADPVLGYRKWLAGALFSGGEVLVEEAVKLVAIALMRGSILAALMTKLPLPHTPIAPILWRSTKACEPRKSMPALNASA